MNRTLPLLVLTMLLATGVNAQPVNDTCMALAKRLASVKHSYCNDAGLKPSGAYTVAGRDILQREFGPVGARVPKARVLLIGGIHGDELTSVSIVFKWLQTLRKHHSGLFHWLVLPALNADGVLQRKASRTNANGVDLNRNFPTPDWYQQAVHSYWIARTRKNARRFPGLAALSEPESRFLAETIHEFEPDVIIAVHAPHGLLDFDGPPQAPKRLGELRLNLLGTYPGSLGNYAGAQRNLPVITMELPYAGIMPKRREISRLWTDLVRWLIDNLPKETGPDFTKGFDAE